MNIATNKLVIKVILTIFVVVISVLVIVVCCAWFVSAEYKSINNTLQTVQQLSKLGYHNEAAAILEGMKGNNIISWVGVESDIDRQLLSEYRRQQNKTLLGKGSILGEAGDYELAVSMLEDIPGTSYYYYNAQSLIATFKTELIGESLHLTQENVDRVENLLANIKIEKQKQVSKNDLLQDKVSQITVDNSLLQDEISQITADLEELRTRLQSETISRELAENTVGELQSKNRQVAAESKMLEEEISEADRQVVLELAKTHPLIMAIVSGKLNVYFEPLPAYSDILLSTVVDSTMSDLGSINLYGARVKTVDNESEADISVRWIKDYGSHTIGSATFNSALSIGLGSTNCLGDWRSFDSDTVTRILWHELGHSLGYGHSKDPNNIMYFQTDTKYIYEQRISEVLSGGWYMTLPLCSSGLYSYSFKTLEDGQRLDLYILKPKEDPDNVAGRISWGYSGCGGGNKVSFTGKCTVEAGSALYIANADPSWPIRVSGDVINSEPIADREMTWDPQGFEYDSRYLSLYWDMFH